MKLAKTALIMLGLVSSGAAQSGDPITDGLVRTFPFRWSAELKGDAAALEFATVYNLHLITGRNTPAGAKLTRARLAEKGPEDAFVPFETKGIPGDFRLTALEANLVASMLVLGGTTGGRPVVIVGKADAKAEVAEWIVLPPFDGQEDVAIADLQSLDERLFVFTRRKTEAGEQHGVWLTNLKLDPSKLPWKALPTTVRSRKGNANFVSMRDVFLAGGTWDAAGQPHDGLSAEVTEGTRWLGAAGPWAPGGQPTPPVLMDALGASRGSAFLMAHRAPRAGDEDSSMTLYYSTDMDGAGMAAWERIPLVTKAARLRAMELDPAHLNLLLVEETETTGTLRLAAYEVPSFLPARRMTDDELEKRWLARSAAPPPVKSREEAMKEAAKMRGFGLFIVPGEDEKTDLIIRNMLRATNFRYMTMSMPVAYLKGDEGAKFMGELKVSGLPAFVVVDKDGRLVGSHTGSVPKADELFRLTEPVRRAQQ